MVVKTQNIDVEETFKAASDSYSAHNFEASFDAFTQILLQDKTHNLAWLGRANAALALGLTDEAEDAFLNVDESQLDEDGKQQLLAGLALMTFKNLPTSEQETRLTKALAFKPDDIRLWNALGRHYDQNGQWGKSTDTYIGALRLGQGRDSVINNLGMSLMYQGRFDEAREKFKQAHDLSPKSELYDNNLRLVAALQGEYKTATEGLKPKKAALLLNDAGMIAHMRGDTDIARSLLKRAISVSPSYHAQAHANLKRLDLLP